MSLLRPIKPVKLKIRSDNSVEIEKARQYPIEKLYPNQLKKLGKVLRSRCIFHADTGNPNLIVYPDTNSYFCFSCQATGDVITLFMFMNKVDFKTAIKELTNK